MLVCYSGVGDFGGAGEKVGWVWVWDLHGGGGRAGALYLHTPTSAPPRAFSSLFWLTRMQETCQYKRSEPEKGGSKGENGVFE